MSREIYVDVGNGRRPTTQVDVNIGNRSNIEVDLNTDSEGKVPLYGNPGQVLTKTPNSYRWENNPIQVDTYEDLPIHPSSSCLYLIKDTLKLVYWKDSSWEYVTSSAVLLYDEDEEMMYIQ